MCGRYMITSAREAMKRVFDVPTLFELAPRYNVAPTQEVPVVRLQEGERELAMLRWGLIPSWAKDPEIGNRMINARGETVAEKPSFRSAFRRRRCLVVADGFYEWQKRPHGPKQPYYITVGNGGPFGFAGLWERWSDPIEDYLVESCTIVTIIANDRLEPIHNRMPVIIDPSDFDAWLDTSGNPAIAQALLAPYLAERMRAYPISTRINNVKNDDPTCIEPLQAS